MSVRSSTVSVDQPIRLSYRLRIPGRSQPIRIQATRTPDDRPMSESELKGLLPQLHDLDAAILRELRSGTVFGQLGDTQLARLLPLLAQRRCQVGEGRLVMDDEPLRPRARIFTDERGKLCLTLALADEDEDLVDLREGRLLTGAQAYFLRDRYAYPVDSPAPWELASWASEPSQDLGGRLGPQERDSLVKRLAKAGVPNEDLEALAVRRGPPDKVVLRVSLDPAYKNPTTRIAAEVHYRDQIAPVLNQAPASAYLISQGEMAGLVERDLATEEQIRRFLRGAKLRFDKDTHTYVAKGETALRILDSQSDIFPEAWTIERNEAPVFHRDLDLQAQVKLLADQGLLDLSVEVQTLGNDDETAEALIGMKDLLAWLSRDEAYIQLRDGSWVAPSKSFRRGLQVLEDLGAESRRALVSPLCIGLLRLLGEHEAVRAADDATQAWMEELSSDGSPRPTEPPDGLLGSLRDYQRRGLDWLGMLHRHRLTGILADDMGLGKTVQTLALLLRVRHDEGPKPSMVIAPTSVIGVWRDEAERFTPDLKVGVLHGPPRERETLDIEQCDLVITSYGILRRDADRLAEIPFRYVILDEAQSAKNAATQNARAVRRLTSERRLALTGTPIENRPEELWATFDFLAPGFLGNLRQFRKRYARPLSRDEEDARTLLRARVQPLLLRRLKTEVAKDLPPKIESVVRCEMGRAQRALYDHVAGKLRESVLQKIEQVGIERAHLEVLAALTRLRQICCDPALLPAPDDAKTPASAKRELFGEIMREALESERCVVVFSQFVKMQRRLIETIQELGVDPLWLHGGTRNRDKVVASFQDPNGPPVIVVSLKAGGTGLTLTRADTVVHYDPWWNPAVERQATDRAHRLGQTQHVNVYKLVCSGTIEERVLAMAQRKDRLAEQLLASEGGPQAKLITTDDVLALLG